MASNKMLECAFALLVVLQASASAAHLPTPNLDNNPDSDHRPSAVVEEPNSSSAEESNIILLNNINKKIWDANSLAPDDIRCYCNLPACVSKGYMCRTPRTHPDGGCFSEKVQVSAGGGEAAAGAVTLPARHGCTNLLIESNETFKCDNNNPISTRRSRGGASSAASVTTVTCCHEDMCNHGDRGPDGRRTATKTASQQQQQQNQHQQQRVKLNQQRDVAVAPASSVSAAAAAASSSSSAELKNSSGAAAVQNDDQQQMHHLRQAKYNQNPRALVDSSGAAITPVINMDSESGDGVGQLVIIACISLLGVVCVIVFFCGIQLLRTDGGLGSSPSSKLNRSDDSGHIMIGSRTPERQSLDQKYYMAAVGGPTVAGTDDAVHRAGVGPMGLGSVRNANPTACYQPLSVVAAQQHRNYIQQKNDKFSEKLSSQMEYHLLAPELVSKLEKGANGGGDGMISSGDESASDRLLKQPMISSRINNNNNNSCGVSNLNNCRTNKDCNCNLAKNCRNCCSSNVKFTNELWSDKRLRQQQQL